MNVNISKQGIIKGNTIIGGANIIPGTTSKEKQYTYPSSSYKDQFSPITIIIPSASQYVLSFYAKSTVNGDIIRSHFYSPNTTTKSESSQGRVGTSVDGLMNYVLTTEWQLYWCVYTQSTTTAVKHVIIPRMGSVIDQPDMSGTGIVSIKCIKLEEGTKPTPWLPSVNDIYNGNSAGIVENELDKQLHIYNGYVQCNEIIEI